MLEIQPHISAISRAEKRWQNTTALNSCLNKQVLGSIPLPDGLENQRTLLSLQKTQACKKAIWQTKGGRSSAAPADHSHSATVSLGEVKLFGDGNSAI